MSHRTPTEAVELPAAEGPSCGGSPREGARSELASGAATGGGGPQAPPTRARYIARTSIVTARCSTAARSTPCLCLHYRLSMRTLEFDEGQRALILIDQ